MSEIIFNSPSIQTNSEEDLKSQIASFQTTLASLNQQIIILRESLQQKDEQIIQLEEKMKESAPVETNPRIDNTLTIVGALINLYKFIFLPGKAEA